MKTAYIVVCGNINEGFSFIGPFPTWDKASEHADTIILQSTWISEISVPAKPRLRVRRVK